MRVACIVNPNARDGKLGKNFHKIEKALELSGIEYNNYMTKGTGHAIEIAISARHERVDSKDGRRVGAVVRARARTLGLLAVFARMMTGLERVRHARLLVAELRAGHEPV